MPNYQKAVVGIKKLTDYALNPEHSFGGNKDRVFNPNKQLLFIGNYIDIPTPRDEYIPENKISIIACHWSAFEKTLIDDYLMFNKNK